MTPEDQFVGKTIIITGAGSGIGMACAKAFHDQGANVILSGRNIERLDSAVQAINPTRHRLHTYACDLQQISCCRALVQAAQDYFGRIDVLVNNAGIFSAKTFVDHTESDFDHYYNTLIKAPFFLSQFAVPHFVKVGGGVIVNIGSAWASQVIGDTPSSAYSSAKAAIHALTLNLAIELAADNIRVVSIAPGLVHKSDVVPRQSMFHPLGRDGVPHDIATSVTFLASPEASWITGMVLPVDGGLTAGRHARRPI